MTRPLVSDIERAVFGQLDRDGIDDWLDEQLSRSVGSRLVEVMFRSGRISAVYGCRLGDGLLVAVKVHREGADVGHLTAAVRAQLRLADAGYACPRPLQEPVRADRRTLVVETMLTSGTWRDARHHAVRRVLAGSLAAQVEILRDLPAVALRAGAPAWARYEHGPWPAPHDPIFDFSATPDGYDWLDELAAGAASVMHRCPGPDVIGHSDWSGGNVRFTGGDEDPVLSAAFDWDSLAARPEPVIVGMSAGSHTLGGAGEGAAPTPAQVAAFVDDYRAARLRDFTDLEMSAAAAAACWVLAYNARCELALLPPGEASASETALRSLAENRDVYVHPT